MGQVDTAALKAANEIVSVIGSHVELKKIGNEYRGLCPFHNDKSPSFYVVPGKQIWRCFSCQADEEHGNDVIGFVRGLNGLSFREACEFLGAEKREWKPIAPIGQVGERRPDRVTSKPPADARRPKMSTSILGEPETIREFRDIDGSLLGFEARYSRGADPDQPDTSPSRVWTWGARGDDAPSWGCGHFNRERPLYGLHRLGEHPQLPVAIFEGPKKADAGQQLLGKAYNCLSWSGGAGSWYTHNFAPLAGKGILLWPDADRQLAKPSQAEKFGIPVGSVLPYQHQPGPKAMFGLAAMLTDPRGVLQCTVRYLDVRDVEQDGYDIADMLAEGMDTDAVIAWAKAPGWDGQPRARDYISVQQNPAPQVDDSNHSVVESAHPPVDPAGAGPSEPPPAEFPPEATLKKPPKRTRPRLASVDGNTALAPEEDAVGLPVSMSEDALADHFAELHAERWRYVAQWGRWFKWCGDVWQEDRTEEIFDLARQLCRASTYWQEAGSLTPDQKRKISRRAMAGCVRDNARADRRIAAIVDQWDTDSMLLGIPGGVVDLRTGKTMDGTPDQYITKKCLVAPEPGPHPLFDDVLNRACAGDDSMRSYLMRWFGYMLTGDVREECFLFLHGPGGSGKGTLVKVIGDILGDYATTISMEALTESKAQRHPQELAKLARARFVYASETEEGRRWNESLIKWLTGRDKVTAHFMRENDFEFYPQFKLLIYGNHIPHLKSVGAEMRRRVHLVEYAGSLSDDERDTTLKDRLVAEYPAILHTMIQGCAAWLDAGLGKPERVSAATDDYLESEDTLGLWLEDNAERDIQAKAQSGDIYRDYKRWAETSGEFCVSQKRFTQAMKQRGFDSSRSGGKRFISGLRLKGRVNDEPPSYPYDE